MDIAATPRCRLSRGPRAPDRAGLAVRDRGDRNRRASATRVFKNAPPTLRDAFLAGRAHGDKTFLVYQRRARQLRGVSRALARVAAEHCSGSACARATASRSRCATCRNGRSRSSARCWSARSRRRSTPGEPGRSSNTAWPTPARRSPSSTASVSSACSSICRTARRSSACFVSRESRGGRASARRKLEDVIGERQRLGRAARPAAARRSISQPDDDATIFYTSGTTGKPKGALGTHRNSCTTILARALRASPALRCGAANPLPAPDPERAAEARAARRCRCFIRPAASRR